MRRGHKVAHKGAFLSEKFKPKRAALQQKSNATGMRAHH
jgi:hypothetical protein